MWPPQALQETTAVALLISGSCLGEGSVPMVPCQPLSLGLHLQLLGSQAQRAQDQLGHSIVGPVWAGSPALVWPQQVTGYGFDFEPFSLTCLPSTS